MGSGGIFFRLARAFKRRLVIERNDGYLVYGLADTKYRLRLMERGFAPVPSVLVSIKLAVWIGVARSIYYPLV